MTNSSKNVGQQNVYNAAKSMFVSRRYKSQIANPKAKCRSSQSGPNRPASTVKFEKSEPVTLITRF